MSDMVCARCDQPIAFRELYHEATRAALIGSGDEALVVPGPIVHVHVYPCPDPVPPTTGETQ